jgi:hypothetical protein
MPKFLDDIGEIVARAPAMTPEQAATIRRLFKYVDPEAAVPNAVNESLTPDDSDLVYEGRARKRPSGASDLTQRIYILLHEHPDGMTRDGIWAVLREGWLETDYYRAYEQFLKGYKEKRTPSKLKSRGRPRAEYGSDLFKERAQKWAISKTLASMTYLGTALHRGDYWHAGRSPHVMVPKTELHRVPMDASAQRSAHQADTTAHVRREQVKAELFAALRDGRVKGRSREVIQHAYDYLAGG